MSAWEWLTWGHLSLSLSVCLSVSSLALSLTHLLTHLLSSPFITFQLRGNLVQDGLL